MNEEHQNNILTSATVRIQTLRVSVFNGPGLFNALPAHIRNLTKIGALGFKNELDRFLKTVVDEPLCRGYTANIEDDTFISCETRHQNQSTPTTIFIFLPKYACKTDIFSWMIIYGLTTGIIF